MELSAWRRADTTGWVPASGSIKRLGGIGVGVGSRVGEGSGAVGVAWGKHPTARERATMIVKNKYSDLDLCDIRNTLQEAYDAFTSPHGHKTQPHGAGGGQGRDDGKVEKVIPGKPSFVEHSLILNPSTSHGARYHWSFAPTMFPIGPLNPLGNPSGKIASSGSLAPSQ